MGLFEKLPKPSFKITSIQPKQSKPMLTNEKSSILHVPISMTKNKKYHVNMLYLVVITNIPKS